MKMKPFAEMLKLSKEKIDELLAPLRASRIEAQAKLEMAKIDEKLITLESDIQELCTSKDVDLQAVIRKLDDIGLLERRKNQFQKLVKELFPK